MCSPWNVRLFLYERYNVPIRSELPRAQWTMRRSESSGVLLFREFQRLVCLGPADRGRTHQYNDPKQPCDSKKGVQGKS